MALYAFDGTWNKDHDAGEYGLNTNVVRLKDLYAETKFFYVGIGTKHGFLGKLIGGAFGVGGQERIAEAKRDVAVQLAKGDQSIDIIGFSRGAALALDFANVLADGVPVALGGASQTVKPKIRFLGLWDVVAAFGIPVDIGIQFSRINLGYKLTLPDNVQRCFHALALDERRPAFRPTRVPAAYECWFRGVHSDIGGGNDNHALNDITLRWMLYKAQGCGLPLPEGCIGASCTAVNPAAPISGTKDPFKDHARDVLATDRAHYTVTERAGCVNPPTGVARESEETERQSVPAIGT